MMSQWAIGVTQILVGSVTIALLLYSLRKGFEDPHVMYCTFGFFLSVEAILTTNIISVCAGRLELRHRNVIHAILQCCGLLCIILGGVKAGTQFGFSLGHHCILGYLAMIMGVLQILTGPSALCLKRTFQIIHISFGMTTFAICSLCTITGFFYNSLKTWLGPTVTAILIVFVIVYTLYIYLISLLKLLYRVRREYDVDDLGNEDNY